MDDKMGRYYRNAIDVLASAFRYCVPISASCLLFASCIFYEDSQPGFYNEEQAQVSFTIRLPQLSVSTSAATRAQTESEMHISTLSAMIFTYDGGEYRFSYRVMGSETTPDGDYQRFHALVLSTDQPLKIIIAANAEDAFESYTPPAGAPESEVRKQLTLAFPDALLAGFLPMYGETLLPDGLAPGENRVTITALRAVARVDVIKDLIPESPDFILEEVYAFRVYDKIRVIPDELDDPSTPRVDAPSIPSDAGFMDDPIYKIVIGGTDAIQQLYVSESYAASTADERLNGTTTIVVGGRFGGSNNPLSYYRVDFDPDLTGDQLGQILRNHRYTFNIKEVKATGWSDPLTAANNRPVSIVVELKDWEEFSSDIYFGDYNFAISSREIALRFVRNREKRLDVESSLDYQIQWLDGNGQPTGDATSTLDVVIGNGNFEVAIVKNPGDPADVTHLRFRTLRNNHGGAVITAKLRITVFNWSIDIDVSQDNTAIYSTRHFNVLSGYYSGSYPTGHLGTTLTLPASDEFFTFGGLAMRKILDVHFNPHSDIKIGGFAFDQISDNTTYLGATTATNLAEVERILGLQNVVYLSFNLRISSAAAALVQAWLRADPHRVLIVNTDSSTTNANMLSLLTADGTWNFTINSGNYSPTALTTATQDFFAGPFGEVAATAVIGRVNEVVGYCMAPSSAVTPLLISSANNYMVFGINKTSRIVYHGDANLFLYGTNTLSNNDGNVNTAPDRFMANLWAWIVEQLIYGDQ